MVACLRLPFLSYFLPLYILSLLCYIPPSQRLPSTHVDRNPPAVMLSLDTTTLPCYFTYHPPSYNHFSTETPCASPLLSPHEPSSPDPANPLLAYRQPQPLPCMSHAESNDHFMQAQTAAAHCKAPHRPSPHPLQNMLYTSSESSADSDDSTQSSDSLGSDLTSPMETARCSRCQRTPSLDVMTGKSNMVSYGLNLWYCTRCAAMVGFKTG